MTTILAIDPGTTRSAWIEVETDDVPGGLTIGGFAIAENLDVLECVGPADLDVVVIEKVASYGMPVGEEVFETVRWAGRFEQAAQPLPVHRLTRKAIVTHLCGSTRAKDANVRRALLDRFGGDAAGRKGGPLYGIKADLWAALAVAVTFADQQGEATR